MKNYFACQIKNAYCAINKVKTVFNDSKLFINFYDPET